MFACCAGVVEGLKKLWDCLDAWWAGSQATSRRARRLRRTQRAIEDPLLRLQFLRFQVVVRFLILAPVVPYPNVILPHVVRRSRLIPLHAAALQKPAQSHRYLHASSRSLPCTMALTVSHSMASAYIPIRSAGSSEMPPATFLARTCAMFALMSFTELTVDMPYKEQCA